MSDEGDFRITRFRPVAYALSLDRSTGRLTIPVTDAMVEAGTSVAWGHLGGADLGGLFDCDDLVARVFEAMTAAVHIPPEPNP